MSLTARAQKSLVASALAGLAKATAALNSAAPRITFFIGSPLVRKTTGDVAALHCAAGEDVVRHPPTRCRSTFLRLN